MLAVAVYYRPFSHFVCIYFRLDYFSCDLDLFPCLKGKMGECRTRTCMVVSKAMHAIYLQFNLQLAVHQLIQHVSYFHVSVADSIESESASKNFIDESIPTRLHIKVNIHSQ